jgi:hypothetical protein
MLKKEPFKKSRRGAVFAIRIAERVWGFVRFRTSACLGILPFFARMPGMPKINWHDDIEKWFASEMSGAEKYESEEFILVGERAFDDPSRAFRPDTYQPPRMPGSKWTVYRRGTVVQVDGPEEVVGMELQRFVNADAIRQMIAEKHAAGELEEI